MWTQRLAKRSEHVHSYVAVATVEGQDRIVANLGLIVSTRGRQRHLASLAMAVKDDHQGRGIGFALLSFANC